MSFPAAYNRTLGSSALVDAAAVTAPLFPLFADLRDRTVLVVGGGAVAERKVEALLHAGALPLVGSLSLNEGLSHWRETGRIRWLEGAFQEHWLDEAWLVIAATDEHDVNRQVYEAATARQAEARVTRWGLVLLLAYLALGLGPIETRKAVRYAVWLTAVVLVVVTARSGSL